MAAQRATFCRICEASCGLLAEVEGGRVRRLSPDPAHVVSRGYACVKGLRFLEVQDSPDRLRTPLKRVGDSFEPVGWDQALREIGARVRALRAAHGDASVGMYLGNPAALSPLHLLFANMFAMGLNTPHVYTSGSQDCNNKFRAAQEMFGSPLLQPIPDLDRCRCAILVGTNPAISQLSFVHMPRAMERLKAIERAGGEVVFVNPRRTESAKQVGRQLFLRPGTDLFFFLAFAHALLEAPVAPRLTRSLDNLRALRACVAPWTPERCAPATGVPAQALRALVERYRAADAAVLYASTGVNQGPHGTLCLWLLNAINAASGHLDRPGGMLLSDATLRTARLAYPKGAAIPRRRSRVGGFQEVLGSMPAGVLPDEITTPGPGQLRALFVSAGNPALTCPNAQRTTRALRQLELLVSIDLFRNETGDLADYVLPATSFLERDELPMGMAGYQPVPYAQLGPALVPPLGEARDEWWIFTQLARTCGAPLRNAPWLQRLMNLLTTAPWLPRPLRFSARWPLSVQAWLAGTTLSALRRRHPSGKRLPRPRGGRLRRHLWTDSGKIDLAPAPFRQALDALEPDALHRRLCDERGGLRLINRRERASHNSWLHNAPSLVDRQGGTNRLHMHPTDAAAHGLAPGARACVRTPSGVLTLPVALDPDLMPGAVAVSHGWGHQGAGGLEVARRTTGANVNQLSADGPAALEPLAGMAHLTAVPVEVTPADRGAHRPPHLPPSRATPDPR